MDPFNKTQYDGMATEYQSYDDLPMSHLEVQLIRRALGDCKGLRILDLGGGSGKHARQAVDAGAELVDVVDISDDMLQLGKDVEAKAGRQDSPIRWLLADASKPLEAQGVGVLPPGQYDVVMANWVFDHAHSLEDLQGMWQNIAVSLKPGGKFLGVRVVSSGQPPEPVIEAYGLRLDEIEEIPGGMKCRVVIKTEPPFSFGATMMEDSYKMINSVPIKLGFTNFETIPAADMDVVKENPEFWKRHLEDPLFAVITADKV